MRKRQRKKMFKKAANILVAGLEEITAELKDYRDREAVLEGCYSILTNRKTTNEEWSPFAETFKAPNGKMYKLTGFERKVIEGKQDLGSIESERP